MKNKDKLTKPTSASRVAGKGLSRKWGSYYTAGVREEKKASSESQTREVEALKAQVARIPELVQDQVEQLGTKLNAMVPTLIHGLTTWIAGGQQGPPPVHSFTASNSHSVQAAPLVSPAAPLMSPAAAPLVSPAEAVFVSPAPARALELNAPGCTPAGTSPASAPSVSCTPAVGGASTLAELDAIITVTN